MTTRLPDLTVGLHEIIVKVAEANQRIQSFLAVLRADYIGAFAEGLDGVQIYQITKVEALKGKVVLYGCKHTGTRRTRINISSPEHMIGTLGICRVARTIEELKSKRITSG